MSSESSVNRMRKRGGEVVILVLLILGLVGCASFRAARLYQQGTASLNSGQAQVAISQLNRAGQLAPGASEIQNHLGLAFTSTGQHEKALSAFRRAVDLDCSNSAAVRNLAAAQASTRTDVETEFKVTTDTVPVEAP